MNRRIVLAVLLPVAQAAAQHEAHHAAADTLGTVHFATSCAPSVTPTFDRAAALLHSFEFSEAIKSFNDVLAKDSTCAMAYWGIALSSWSNPMAPGNKGPAQLAAGRAAVVAGTKLNATPREQGYIGAVGQLYDDYEHHDQRTRVVAYAQAMEQLVAAQAADTEARIFYAISLAASAAPTDKTYANQLKAGAILEPLFAKLPNHPGLAHYIIHTYDYPALAAKADSAAHRYAEIAPSAAHALHMPSHTFTRVGSWQESIETNRRSMEVALSQESIAEALHAADYMTYAYFQLGDEKGALDVLNRVQIAAVRFDPTVNKGAAPGNAGVFALAAIPARWALERRDWKAAAMLVPNHTAFPWTESMTWFTRSLGASLTGDFKRAAAANDSLGAIYDRLIAMKEPYWAEQTDIQRLSAAAWYLFAKGHKDSALALMREAARREDATDKSAVSPGPLAPARELLGDMLMELKRPREALVEYRATLEKEPNRRLTLLGVKRAEVASRSQPLRREKAGKGRKKPQ